MVSENHEICHYETALRGQFEPAAVAVVNCRVDMRMFALFVLSHHE